MLRMYRPRVEPVTPMITTIHGLRWNNNNSNTRTVHAGGAKTGMLSTTSAATNTRTYIHMREHSPPQAAAATTIKAWRNVNRATAARTLVVLNMGDDVFGSLTGSSSNQVRDSQTAGAMSRRRMLATSAGALVGASMIGAGKAATETNIG